jgi:hypothetical protein
MIACIYRLVQMTCSHLCINSLKDLLDDFVLVSMGLPNPTLTHRHWLYELEPRHYYYRWFYKKRIETTPLTGRNDNTYAVHAQQHLLIKSKMRHLVERKPILSLLCRLRMQSGVIDEQAPDVRILGRYRSRQTIPGANLADW